MKKALGLLIAISLLAFKADKNEEGIFPLSYLNQLDLKQAGLKIETSEIYSETDPSLVNALVRLGGCTGSFISDQGLIITNHHCVYSTVASLSTPENNYLENGFYATNQEDELVASFECKITQSFKDVSKEVLNGVKSSMDAMDQQNLIAENIRAIVEEEQKQHPDLTIDISEMLVGKSYTLFRYKMLNDVRVVYVPPKNIGKFGGETDNWEWPRHNGDFSIVRAYENGKPYKPAKYLEVNPSGTKEGDFAFILGYPGRTYRNQPAQFLEYQNNFVLPIISDWFDFRINAIENFIGDDEAKKLAYSGTLASLSNVTKNFKGKMQGLQRTSVIATTRRDQELLKKYAEKHDLYKSYLPLFDRLDSLYQEKFEITRDYLYLGQLYSTAKLFSTAVSATRYRAQTSDMSKAECKKFIEENKENIAENLQGYAGAYKNFELDLLLFQELFYQLSMTKDSEMKKLYKGVGSTKAEIYSYAEELYSDKNYAEKVYDLLEAEKYDKFISTKSDLTEFASKLDPILTRIVGQFRTIEAEINAIIPRINDVEMEMNLGTFVPDANSTLRFTYGYVKGYEPEDAVVMSPFTTIQGIIEKSEGSTNPDYYLQSEIIEKFKSVEPADVLKHPKNKQVVVGFIYNMDTTGGNSGSPIMDAYGRIVGINFDRSYTATINDYAWDESYSRSIGVDIRYVLYVMKYFGEADELLDEIGVDLDK
ncbi:S46 family peptidase [bacterium]|nr:S46 family peptidase [bacterium]